MEKQSNSFMKEINAKAFERYPEMICYDYENFEPIPYDANEDKRKAFIDGFLCKM